MYFLHKGEKESYDAMREGMAIYEHDEHLVERRIRILKSAPVFVVVNEQKKKI